MEKLVLIDGNSLINRAFYATPPLSDKKGNPTNAVYGFTNMLVKIISDIKPTNILVAFDRREPTFRHKLFDGYKGTRKPMPEDLRPQVLLLKEVLDTIGITRFELAGYEADDIIGTLAKKFNVETIIITGDKDSFQLVDDTTSVYFTKRGISDIEEYNAKNFTEKTGIVPKQVIDMKATMGDSSDNIPGILGVGEKTALSLIQTYGDIETLYEHTEDLKGKLLEKVLNGKDSAFMSKILATIDVNVPLDIELKDTAFSFPFGLEVKRLFSELDFRAVLKREELFVEGEEEVKEEVKIINSSSLEDFKKVISEKEFSFVLDENLHLATDDKTEYIFKLSADLFGEGISLSEALDLLKPIFEDENRKIVCYNYKSLYYEMKSYGIKLNCKFDDIDVLRYIADFSGREESLKETLYDYSLSDKTPSSALFKLRNDFYSVLKEDKTEELYEKVELPLVNVLISMEEEGFKVDVKTLDELGEKYKAELDELLVKIQELAGDKSFNPRSTKQLGDVLFNKLGLNAGKKNKSGFSTNADVLEELVDAHPIIPLILRYRAVHKLYSTYIEGFREYIDKKTCKVHTKFNQTLTQTGRLSSKEPNMQNIPARGEGKELRQMFTASDEKHILIDADYSQIELRLLAHFSGSKELIKAYNEGKDIHAITASQVFGVDLKDVTPEMRKAAKSVNFGIIYGISEYGLSKDLKIPVKEASEYIKKYFEMYPSVKEYMNLNVEFAKKNGYVTSLLGRKRVIKEINSPNYNLRTFGERAAMNMPLQGTAADVIKVAMVNVYDKLKKGGYKSKLIMQVHDELVIDATIEEKEEVTKILLFEMENAVKLLVPLTADVEVGGKWLL